MEHLSKKVEIRLFFNKLEQVFYVRIGDCLFKVKDTIATALQEKENLMIVHADNVKHIQELCNGK